MIPCETCGTENIEGTVFCDNCGSELPEGAFGADESNDSSMLELPLIEADKAALFHLRSGEIVAIPDKKEIIIGREDPVSGIFPDIDTSVLGGEEDGVSRRHAKISIVNEHYYIEDLNSVNYTYLNQEKLTPNKPL